MYALNFIQSALYHSMVKSLVCNISSSNSAFKDQQSQGQQYYYLRHCHEEVSRASLVPLRGIHSTGIIWWGLWGCIPDDTKRRMVYFFGKNWVQNIHSRDPGTRPIRTKNWNTLWHPALTDLVTLHYRTTGQLLRKRYWKGNSRSWWLLILSKDCSLYASRKWLLQRERERDDEWM